MKKVEESIKWTGNEYSFVDEPDVTKFNDLVLGRFGGNSSAGQYKNEDGCLIWADDDKQWEFVLLLDAHKTAESAELVANWVKQSEIDVHKLLNQKIHSAYFKELENYFVSLFEEARFLDACRSVQGETACLIAVRKEKYLWWFSVGDCLLYLFHPELMKLGQYAVNQRQFFEWIGEVNTFGKAVPCYSSGTRELRQGENHVFLTTDGLVECPGLPFADPKAIVKSFEGATNEQGVEKLLNTIQEHGVRDSTTIVSWTIKREETAAMPSDQ